MTENTHARFMRRAIDAAKIGIDDGQTPFGACIVKDGEIIAAAHNTVWSDTDITAHAEVQVIRRACRALSAVDLSGTMIYSTCEPCPMCFSACHWARIDAIVYGAEISDAASYGFNEMPISNEEMKKRGQSSVELVPNILREPCRDLFDRWADAEDARNY